MFGNFHRLSAETYKSAELEILTGAAALMAEYNNVGKAAHVRDKLTWLAAYAEATEIIGLAACEHCVSEPDSDLVYPNPLYANIAKLFFADNWHQAIKYPERLGTSHEGLSARLDPMPPGRLQLHHERLKRDVAKG
jgi:4-hydroxybutyryl-CoA dehydratase/vinylacetyl-CoA-Delta-isomerase